MNQKFTGFIRITLLIIQLFAFYCFCDSIEDPETPLFLTPFIEAEKIEEARKQSDVKPFLPNVFSNSGYLTVNKTTGSHLFFWFFQKHSKDWVDSPVLLWLQGGPGCSSLFGLFTELGPYEMTSKGLQKSRFPWTNNYNVLYIDNPVGTGFSLAPNSSLTTTQEEIAEHLYIALIQFFKLFPELQKNKFFITGESYAGKYIPAIAYKIYKSNLVLKFQINLKGLLIGNGFTDPVNMMDYGEYLHRLGLVDKRTKLRIQAVEEDTRILIHSASFLNAWKSWENMLGTLRNVTGMEYFYDYLHEKFSGDESFVNFLRTSEIKKAIHVGSVVYESCSDAPYYALSSDIFKSVKSWVEELVEVYPMMFYSGQTDIIVAHSLTTDFLQELDWSGAQEFREAARNKWYVKGRLAGYYTKTGNLIQALIRDAGHMVPTSRPKVMLDLLDKFVQNTV